MAQAGEVGVDLDAKCRTDSTKACKQRETQTHKHTPCRSEAPPVQQRAVQRWICIVIHAKFAVVCEERGGGGACSLRHPQYLVQVIIRITGRTSKYNNNIVNLKLCIRR